MLIGSPRQNRYKQMNRFSYTQKDHIILRTNEKKTNITDTSNRFNKSQTSKGINYNREKPE